MTKISLALALLAAATPVLSRATAPSVSVQYVNATAGEQADSNIWVNFANGGLPTIDSSTGAVTYNASGVIGTANIWNPMTSTYVATNITTNSSYQLSTVQNGTFSISGFGGGRTYVSYGSSLSDYNPVIGPYPGWQPAPATPAANFTTRFQAFEFTTQATTASTTDPNTHVTTYSFSNTNQTYADLSYIDEISISTGIKVVNAPTGTTNPTQTSANTKTLVDAVAVYGANAASSTTYTAETNVITKAGSGTTQYYQVAGQALPATSTSYKNPGSTSIANPAPLLGNLSNFVRVAGPGQMPTVGGSSGVTSLYHTWDSYINALNTGGSLNSAGTLVTSLAGSYGPANTAALAYEGTATFESGTITLGTVQYTGYVLISGLTYGGTAQSDIYVPYTALNNSTGLYGTNPGYSINQGALITVPGNTLQTRVVGDLVAGMNFGTVGSTTMVTYNGSTKALGAFSSQDWWSIGLLAHNGYQGGYLFGGAQSNSNFYNTYAAALQNLTSGYAFGIEDRLGQNTTEFNLTTGDGNNNTVLQFLIQPDLAAVPEPSTVCLVGLGLGALALRFRRR